jgi:hypothetical protein
MPATPRRTCSYATERMIRPWALRSARWIGVGRVGIRRGRRLLLRMALRRRPPADALLDTHGRVRVACWTVTPF